jgi:acylpyruvate hydrolase
VDGTSQAVDYEAELAFVIGKRAYKVSEEEGLDYVAGYATANDVTARDVQFADTQWVRGKSLDTFCPVGPWLITKDEVPDPHNLAIRCRVNGVTLQDSNTNQLIYKIPALVSFLSQGITLEPGDIVLTGTPPGIGFARKPQVLLKPGDVVEIDIEQVGLLQNTVKER